MSTEVCFNTLSIQSSEETINRFLQTGLALPSPDAPPTPLCQQFSLANYAKDATEVASESEIFTHWIERLSTVDGQQLIIEFECLTTPPLALLRSVIDWLHRQADRFVLSYRYRFENHAHWAGEVEASAI